MYIPKYPVYSCYLYPHVQHMDVQTYIQTPPMIFPKYHAVFFPKYHRLSIQNIMPSLTVLGFVISVMREIVNIRASGA